MMNTAKGIAIGFIAAMMIFWLCSRLGSNIDEPTEDVAVTKTDTADKEVKGTGTSEPVITKTTPGKKPGAKRDTVYLKGDIEYIFDPSRDYDSLIEQHNELYALYTTQNEYSDIIWLDSTRKSFVKISDLVAANKLVDRKYDYTWVYPVITSTTSITKKEKPRIKLLVGGGVAGTRLDPLMFAEADAMIVGKKGGAIGLNFKYNMNTTEKIYGIKKLWLISFRRRK